MMFTSPRVIAIDDDARHLSGLVTSLNSHGVACLPIHFKNEPLTIRACPDVRVVFADLHLGVGILGADPTTDFGVIGDLLENAIKPVGPYFILLWTMYPIHASTLQEFLVQRVQGVTKPFAVVPLAKADYLDGDGNVKNEDALMARITEISATLPPVGALFDWERRVVEATGQTVSSILDLGAERETDARVEAFGRILRRLAVASVGRDRVETRRFRAVNEALLPILADRIANLPAVEGEDDVWQAALGTTAADEGLTLDEAAKLNRLVHIADSADVEASGTRCGYPPAKRHGGQTSKPSSGSKKILLRETSFDAGTLFRKTVESVGYLCSVKPLATKRSHVADLDRGTSDWRCPRPMCVTERRPRLFGEVLRSRFVTRCGTFARKCELSGCVGAGRRSRDRAHLPAS